MTVLHEDHALDEAQFAMLSDEDVEKAKRLAGQWLRRDVHWPATYEPLSPHDIRRWAVYAVGDDNPLWCDASYGARSRFGSNVAPPSIFYSIDTAIVAPGLPGIQWIHGGNDWEFLRPVRPGDTVRAAARLIDVVEKKGRHAPRFLDQIGEVLYTNQRDELVARTVSHILRVPRARSGGGMKGFDHARTSATYTKMQIEQIAAEYAAETRRGSEPRYWEDVCVGDTLDSRIKGPLTLVDIVAFYAGRRNVYNPLKFAFAERIRHPGNVYVSPRTGIPVHPAAGHFDTEIAAEIGMPGAYDQGFMRINWLCHLVTDWAGDHGWVRNLSIQNRLPNVVGDLSRCNGVVTKKADVGAERVVHCDIWIENQRGEKTSRGTAIVCLPSQSPEVGLPPAST